VLRSKTRAARAGIRRFGSLSGLRAHTKAPYKTDLHRKTLMALNSPGTARTVGERLHDLVRPRRRRLAEGESVIKYKFPLNVLKDTYESYDHSCY
jgi:hypothetical protein